MTLIRKTFLVFFCLVLTNIVQAAPVYKVEVLVFEHLTTAGINGEIWRDLTDSEKPDSFTSIELDAGNEGAYQTLPSQDLNLTGVRKRLDASEDYQVVLHSAWRQPAMERGESTPVWIESAGLVEGQITLDKGRYLHFGTNLVFQQLGRELVMQERRRIKSKELHYFDHPKFGMLVRVVQL